MTTRQNEVLWLVRFVAFHKAPKTNKGHGRIRLPFKTERTWATPITNYSTLWKDFVYVIECGYLTLDSLVNLSILQSFRNLKLNHLKFNNLKFTIDLTIAELQKLMCDPSFLTLEQWWFSSSPYGAKGQMFVSRPRHLNFRDWASPAFKSQYHDCKTVSNVQPQNKLTNQPNQFYTLMLTIHCDPCLWP